MTVNKRIEAKLPYIIMSIFNLSYKAGVMDAEDVDDPELYSSYEREMSVSGCYGRINNYQRYDIHGWRIQLLQLMRGKASSCLNFLLKMDIGKNYMNCVYPLSLEFYMMGIRDYNENPTIHDFYLFDNSRCERWTKNGIVHVSKMELLSFVQEFGFKRSVIDSETRNKYSMSKHNYETFARRLWLAICAAGYKGY